MIHKFKIKGFTLVELLVVMAIIGVLVALAAGNFRTAQMRGRDAQRKSDLKQISHSLELFYADYGKYPSASGTQIAGCPYNPTTKAGTSCVWGGSEFTDGKTIYFKNLPNDPGNDDDYVYQIVPDSNNQKYKLFTNLENPQDKDCLNNDCTTAPYNFGVTSANTNATE